MCSVSNVVAGWNGPGPNQVHWPTVYGDPALAGQMLAVLAALEALDKRLGAIECKVAEPEKEALKGRLEAAARGEES